MSTHTAKVVKNPRLTSAKPPLRVHHQNDDSRPIKAQDVPKWKQESEQIRRALGRSSADSANQYNLTGSTVNSQL